MSTPTVDAFAVEDRLKEHFNTSKRLTTDLLKEEIMNLVRQWLADDRLDDYAIGAALQGLRGALRFNRGRDYPDEEEWENALRKCDEVATTE